MPETPTQRAAHRGRDTSLRFTDAGKTGDARTVPARPRSPREILLRCCLDRLRRKRPTGGRIRGSFRASDRVCSSEPLRHGHAASDRRPRGRRSSDCRRTAFSGPVRGRSRRDAGPFAVLPARVDGVAASSLKSHYINHAASGSSSCTERASTSTSMFFSSRTVLVGAS
jgi:hypothetical protein